LRKVGEVSFFRKRWKGVAERGGLGVIVGRFEGDRRFAKLRVPNSMDLRREEAAEGEIFNVSEERTEMEGFGWVGEVDVEVLLGVGGRWRSGVFNMSSIERLIVSTFSRTLTNLSSTTDAPGSYREHFMLGVLTLKNTSCGVSGSSFAPFSISVINGAKGCLISFSFPGVFLGRADAKCFAKKIKRASSSAVTSLKTSSKTSMVM